MIAALKNRLLLLILLNSFSMFQNCLKKSNLFKKNVFIRGAHKFNHVQQYGSVQANHFNGPEPDDPCNIQFTSGTTGYPKAAVVSHFSVVNNGILSGYRNEFDTGHHRICVQNPFFHSYVIVQGISAGIEHGATLVLPNSAYNPVHSLQSIVEEKYFLHKNLNFLKYVQLAMFCTL